MTRDQTRREEGSAGEAGGGGGGTPGKVTRSEKIQRRAAGGAEPSADALSGMSVSGGGAPLPDGVRGRFESSLGADLGGVRVHTGGDSAEAARGLNAQAFTVGNDIHFGEGRFQPEDPFGMHLLAHEVAHTQQQAGGSGGAQLKGLDVSLPGDASEVEADRAADAMVKGAPATVSAAGASVQRFFGLWDEDEEGGGGGGGTTQDAVAEPAKKKAEYLQSYLHNRAFPWDLLQPEAKGKKRLTRQIIEDWLTFYQLVVYGAPFPDRMQDCNFNGASTNVNGVWSIFMKESKAANFIDDPFGAYEIISKDQKAKRDEATRVWEENQKKNNGGGGGPAEPPKYWPGKEPVEDDKKKAAHGGTHLEIEWEFTPAKAKIGWDGHVEAEGPEHELKGELFTRVKEVGGWTASVTGSGLVKFKGSHLEEIGGEIAGKMSRDLFEHVAIEFVGKVVAANKKGEPSKGREHSVSVHVEPSAEVSVEYEIPGTKGKLKVKGGVSADPEGFSAGASFVVTWD